MKATPNALVEPFRARRGPLASDPENGNNGVFALRHNNTVLSVVVSDGGGWDHVSVATPTRCPTWEEMEYVRDLFACSDEWWMQLGTPKAAHVNCHPYCLHWWRPQTWREYAALRQAITGAETMDAPAGVPAHPIPIPPSWMVGPHDGETVDHLWESLKQALHPYPHEAT